MPKKIISLSFSYARETKNFHVYNLSGQYDFFPKKIHISKGDIKEPAKKVTVNIIIGED